MTRDVPTLPPIRECTENHISPQIENEEKRHVKKFQILCIATNWAGRKRSFIADWSNYDIFIGIIDHSHNLDLFRKTVNAASGSASHVEQVKSGEKYVFYNFILIMFIFIKKNLQSFSLIFLSLSKQFATKLILDRIPHWKTKFLIIILICERALSS